MLNNKCKVHLTIKFDDKDVLWRLTEGDLYNMEENLNYQSHLDIETDSLKKFFNIMINMEKKEEEDGDDDMFIKAKFEIDWGVIVQIFNDKIHLKLLSKKTDEGIKNLYRKTIMDKIVDPLVKRLNRIFEDISIPSYEKKIHIRTNDVDFFTYKYLYEIGYIFNIKISAVAHSSGDKHV